jgi:hypothetical protein
VSELLSSTIKVPHEDLHVLGDFVHLQRSITLLLHDLGPKVFYPGRDKSGLEGMTRTCILTGVSERALSGIAGRVKN